LNARPAASAYPTAGSWQALATPGFSPPSAPRLERDTFDRGMCDAGAPDAPMTRKLLLAVPLLVLFGVAAWTAISATGRHDALAAVAWLRVAGVAGVVIFAALYVVSVLAFVPAVWLAAMAGYLYGVRLGLAISVPATLAGAVLAFVLGRSIARDAVRAFAARRPRLRAFDDALADGGYRLVVLLRLCMPHNLLNYGLAASRVSLGSFTLGTAIGGWPLTVLFCLGARSPPAPRSWCAPRSAWAPGRSCCPRWAGSPRWWRWCGSSGSPASSWRGRPRPPSRRAGRCRVHACACS
jgi:uncharacterized membrane protein YdjX (TVP38/TMEM64 family)